MGHTSLFVCPDVGAIVRMRAPTIVTRGTIGRALTWVARSHRAFLLAASRTGKVAPWT